MRRRVKAMPFKPDEFIRRFLLHALPDGFHRIRHFGFLANGHRTQKLALCRSLLTDGGEPTPRGKIKSPTSAPSETVDLDPPPCPECGGVMRIIADLPAAANGLGPRGRRFGATLHERDYEDPTDDLASRLSHRAANWRPSKRFAPSRRRGLHPTPLARAPRASEPRFASDRSSKRSRSPRLAASRSDDNPKLPGTKPIAPPARTSPRLRSIRLQ